MDPAEKQFNEIQKEMDELQKKIDEDTKLMEHYLTLIGELGDGKAEKCTGCNRLQGNAANKPTGRPKTVKEQQRDDVIKQDYKQRVMEIENRRKAYFDQLMEWKNKIESSFN